MALTFKPVFPQTPKTAGIVFDAVSEDTSLLPATVAPTIIVTAGADGSLVTSLVYASQETSALEKVVLWIQPGGTGDWYMVKEFLQVAYTQAATTIQAVITMVDKTDPDTAIRMAALDKLGITHHIDQNAMAYAEYTDF